MLWNPCPETEHQWQFIPEWTGRYRCQDPSCGVIGYKAAAVLPPDVRRRSTSITPYRCPTCHGPTTQFRYKRPGEFRGRNGAQLCPRCR